MNEEAGAINRLYNRLVNMIGRGRVTAVDDSGPVQLVQISLNANEVRDNIPRIQEFGDASNPPIGTDVAAAFIAGDRSNGAVIGTNNQQYRMKNLQHGEKAIYNAFGQYVYLTENGIVIEANNLPVTVNGATIITIHAANEVILETPILKVSGDIIDNYHTNTDNMGNMRTIYNSHTHPGIQPGNANTGTPNQLE